ncbi:cytochrome P450 [Artomyces pyxidatus]|uniref:Cytochrome P450 n=1 Tax=Artomyces pyxidatus TaxID=48021 RepID=A0ACB8SPY6_9AGAM|nr:cytochrome P450 [Artomyces pyxidatus]
MTYTVTIVIDLSALALFFLLLSLLESQRKRKGLRYPPGPFPLPIVGNLFDIPSERSWLVYTEWGKTYGDITSAQVFGHVLVVLNSAKAARDLLEKRAAIYSGRPAIPFFDLQVISPHLYISVAEQNHRMRWNPWFVLSSPITPMWRLRRKMLDRGLRPSAAVQFRPMQKEKVHDFLKHLLSQPQNFRHHIEYLQGAIIMSIVYGYDVEGYNDVYLKTALAANAIGQAGVLPGSVLVNALSLLKYLPGWLPGMGFQTLAREGERLGNDMVNRPFQLVKDNMRHGTARPSVTQINLLELENICDAVEFKKGERAIAEASGSLYLAGADTTSSAIGFLFNALALYPDVQRKAQAEIDAVTGGRRLPAFEDRSRLPYVEALCKEVLRWRIVSPAGMPHMVVQDDVHERYFIPKGATVISNIWAILHDARVYPDPDEFKPERFLTADGRPCDDPALALVFGFGKRVCPGRHIAGDTLFIVAASILATYTIGKAKDAQGHDIPVGNSYRGAITSHPEEFKCSIVPRSGKAEELITGSGGDEHEMHVWSG